MARRHLERADMAVLIADASVGVTSHDATIASYAEQSGRSVIIVMNKWDLALEAAAEKAAKERSKKPWKKKAPQIPNKLLAEYEPHGARKVEIPRLCADRFCFGAHGRSRGEALLADRSSGRGARSGESRPAS